MEHHALAEESRNDFPLFQATVLLAGHAFLVISGLVPGVTRGRGRREPISSAAGIGVGFPVIRTPDIHSALVRPR